MDCFYFIDKPLAISSFDIIRNLRKKLNIRRLGHTGTLDPLATGGVLLAVGNYTKLIPYFEKDTKEYEFIINLDGVTDSYDLAENVQYISDSKKDYYKGILTKEYINDILEDEFIGKITQIPPKYSALKINGKKAYDLARAGVNVQMKKREVTIHEIEILNFKYPELKLRAKVSAGTYIRSIASDLGDIIGSGGYISFLRRTKIGKLDISLSQKLDNFDSCKFLNIEELFGNHLFISLDEDILDKLNNGLKVIGKFNFDKHKELFVIKNNTVTNIIIYDGEQLVPKKKI